jgi:isopenicillin-N N-acyltransferase-like protein
MRRPPIRILDAAGTHEQIGAAHGAGFAEEIRKYASHRVDLVVDGLWSGGSLARGDVLALADSMLPAHEAFDAGLHAEMLSMAEAAGITPAEAVIVGGFTDFVPDARAAGAGFLAQTWDMHDTATDHVLLMRLVPDDAPASTVFTTTGCLGQIGMNEAGLCVGINNLSGADGRRGVTWTSVVRGMLQCQSADEALQVLLDADLAGAHNFLIYDAGDTGYDVEAMPSARPYDRLGDHPILHTNHTLRAEARAAEIDKDPDLLASSVRRLELARELLADGDIDADRLMALTREPTAICQRPAGAHRLESSGAAIMRPRSGEFWACWGPPADNDYVLIEAPLPDRPGRARPDPETV